MKIVQISFDRWWRSDNVHRQQLFCDHCTKSTINIDQHFFDDLDFIIRTLCKINNEQMPIDNDQSILYNIERDYNNIPRTVWKV